MDAVPVAESEDVKVVVASVASVDDSEDIKVVITDVCDSMEEQQSMDQQSMDHQSMDEQSMDEQSMDQQSIVEQFQVEQPEQAEQQVESESLLPLLSQLSSQWSNLDFQLKHLVDAFDFVLGTRRDLHNLGPGDFHVIVQERSVLGTQIQISRLSAPSSNVFTRLEVQLRSLDGKVVQREDFDDVNELCSNSKVLKAFDEDRFKVCSGFDRKYARNKGFVDAVQRSSDCLRVVEIAVNDSSQFDICRNCLKWTATLAKKPKKMSNLQIKKELDVCIDRSKISKRAIVRRVAPPLTTEKRKALHTHLDQLKSRGLITVSLPNKRHHTSHAVITPLKPVRSHKSLTMGADNGTRNALQSLDVQIKTGVIEIEKLPSKESRLDAESAQSLIEEYRQRKEKANQRREARLLQEKESSKRVLRTCKICLFQHADKETFTKHLEMHEQRFDLKAMVRCPECNEELSKVELNPHYQKYHDKEKACCIECQMVMSPIELRLNHLDKVHFQNVKSKLCPVCGDAFRTDKDLEVHYAVQHDPHAFGGICDLCGLSFKHKKLLGKHMWRYHTQVVKGFIQCPFCDQTFKKSENWHSHIKVHAITKPYRCPYCDFGSYSRNAVSAHIQKLHDPLATLEDVVGDGNYTFLNRFGQEVGKPNIKDYIVDDDEA